MAVRADVRRNLFCMKPAIVLEMYADIAYIYLAYGRGFLSDDRPVNTSEIPPFVVERSATTRRPHPGYQPHLEKSEQDNEASPFGLTVNETPPNSTVDKVQSKGGQTQDTSEVSLKVPNMLT